MELGEFAPSRIVEAVVHGFDLTDALGRETIATPDGVAFTAGVMDELLGRRTVGRQPSDLSDDLAWVRAASGRAPHDNHVCRSSAEATRKEHTMVLVQFRVNVPDLERLQRAAEKYTPVMEDWAGTTTGRTCPSPTRPKSRHSANGSRTTR